MPALKLVYFDGRGRAEPIRWILAAGKVAFEQDLFTFEQWPAKKTGTPYGSVPVLYVDGRPLCQTVAIARYAGTIGGLVASDPMDNAVGDEVADTAAEMYTKLFDILFEKDAEKKAADEKAFYEDYVPKFLNVFESRIGNKFLFDDKGTWQDVFLGNCLSRLQETRSDVLKPFPKLEKMLKNVKELEGIKAYLASPPKYSLPF